MSVNYHAFQSRGFLFSEYEAVSQQWRSRFSHFDPARIIKILDLKRDDTCLYLSYFQTPYRLRLQDGWLEKETRDGWSDALYFNETMSIYHLLHYTKDFPRTGGAWVSNESLDGAGSRQVMPDPLLVPFARKFTQKAHLLQRACEGLGGKKLTSGDVSYEFSAFPQIPIRLVFWDSDEDFPAQLQALVEKTVTDYVHFETTGCILSDLLEKLEGEGSYNGQGHKNGMV